MLRCPVVLRYYTLYNTVAEGGVAVVGCCVDAHAVSDQNKRERGAPCCCSGRAGGLEFGGRCWWAQPWRGAARISTAASLMKPLEASSAFVLVPARDAFTFVRPRPHLAPSLVPNLESWVVQALW